MDRKIKLYEVLKDGKYHTSNELAKELDLSDKTVRKMLKGIKNIEIKKGLGYRVHSDVSFEIPKTTQDRKEYILSQLIIHDFIKIDDLSYKLNTSNRTISNDLKDIKIRLSKFNLTLISKPYYGLTILGDEINIRKFIISCMEDRLNKNIFDKNIFSEKFNLISKDTLAFIKENMINFSDIAFINLVITIYVMFKRLEKNKILYKTNKSLQSSLNIKIKEFINKLNVTYYPKCKLNETEMSYIVLHFLSKRTLTLSETKSEEITNLIKDIQKYLYITYNLKISNEKEFYNNLYKHLIPLTIRLRFNISFTNPILNEIKENMPFSYNVATYMSEIISKKFDSHISEDEIGYLAVIFEMYIEKKKNILKKRVLIICPLGRGTSKFLQYTYKKLFSDYIEFIHTTGAKDLKFLNLDNYDLIFSLTDIKEKIEKPIYKVNCFLKDKEIEKIKTLFESNVPHNLHIPKELFIHITKTTTKNKVIKILCNLMQKHTKTNLNLYKEVLEREKLGYTEIINNIAIPHPLTKNFKFNKVAVAILDKKIKWDKTYVNIVFLICIHNIDMYSEILYSKLSSLFYSKKNLKFLLNNPTYSTLITLLEKGEHL